MLKLHYVGWLHEPIKPQHSLKVKTKMSQIYQLYSYKLQTAEWSSFEYNWMSKNLKRVKANISSCFHALLHSQDTLGLFIWIAVLIHHEVGEKTVTLIALWTVPQVKYMTNSAQMHNAAHTHTHTPLLPPSGLWVSMNEVWGILMQKWLMSGWMNAVALTGWWKH